MSSHRAKTIDPPRTKEVTSVEHQKCRAELRRVNIELKEAQVISRRLSDKNGELRTRVAQGKMREFTLRQHNMSLLEMVKAHMEREASLVANTQAVWKAYPVEKKPEDAVKSTLQEMFGD